MAPFEELRAAIQGDVFDGNTQQCADRIAAAVCFQKVMLTRKPAAWVVARRAPEDIQATVQFARKHKLAIYIFATGHSSFGVGDGGIVLDVSQLKSIEVDAANHRVRFGPGNNLGNIVDETAKASFQIPLGVISHTGVGLLLGGGVGFLARSHGLAVDSIISLKAVDGTGALIDASRTNNPDAFMALKGVPGAAVVYEFEAQGYPHADPFVVIQNAPLNDAGRAAVRSARDFLARAETEAEHRCTTYIAYGLAPDGSKAITIASVFVGPEAEGRAFLAPIMSLPSVQIAMAGIVPWSGLVRALDPLMPPAYWYSTGLRIPQSPSDQALDMFADVWANSKCAVGACVIEQRGGKVREGVDSFSPIKLSQAADGVIFQGFNSFEDMEANIPSIRAQKAELLKSGLFGESIGANFESVEGTDGKFINAQRFAAFKAKHDPDSIFRHSSPVRV